MYVCVYAPKAIITSGVILTLYDWWNNFCYFSVPFYGFAVDVIDRRGPSNEMRRQLQPKRTKVRL